MGRIAVLPDDVANKIAAGEVVERPASVVKELIENSLDAGATRIRVDLEDGGKALIRVVDDGMGMTPDDAYLAVQPHATSKIRIAQDLAAIETLGFRGEALPSIASVSEFSLVTRPHDADCGTQVAIQGGEGLTVNDAGCAPGTTITVRQLFHNVPARLKFLKTTATELGRVRDLLGRFALSHPAVSLVLHHDGSELFRSDASTDLRSRLADVFGRSAVADLIPVEFGTPLLEVGGVIGNTQFSKTTRAGHYLFVNSRAVRCAMVSHAVEQAFGDLLPHGRKPVAVLFITMDAALVDPNVHPTKAEVRFTRESDIYRTMLNAVRDALFSADLAPTAAAEMPDEGVAAADRPSPPAESRQLAAEALLQPSAPSTGGGERVMGATPVAARAQPVASSADMAEFRAELQAHTERATAPAPSTGSAVPPPQSFAPAASQTAVVGQALRSYVIAEIDGALCIIDQHAAHERVLYERALQAMHERPLASQGLVVPPTADVSPTELAAARDNAELLERLGFSVEAFGRNSIIVRAAPAALKHRDPVAAVRDLLEALCGEGEFGHIRDIRERLAASMACKAAVKADEPLATAEMQALIKDLLACSNQSTCPHGRPIVLRMTTTALERQFRRR